MLIRKSLSAAAACLIGLALMHNAYGQEAQQAPPSVHVPQAQQSSTQNTKVPDILAGAAKRGQNPATSQTPNAFRAPQSTQVPADPTSIRPLSTSQPLRTQSQERDSLQDGPRVAPEELKQHQMRIEEQLRRIKAQMNNEATSIQRPAAESKSSSLQDASAALPPAAQTEPAAQASKKFGFTTTVTNAENGQQQASASEAQSPMSTTATIQQSTISQQNRTYQAAHANQLPAGNVSSMGQPVNQIRQVSGNSYNGTNTRQPGISMAAPAVEVQAFGPKTIGINKTANYQVVIRNMGRVDAEKILIGVDLPKWVEVINVTHTNGTRKVNNVEGDSRLLWTVDRVTAGSSQTLSIDATPRKAEMFDLGVEWTYLPRNAVTSVEVTEPRLDMKISGPRDVLYGEKAVYHVTVRNPGTGTAENVHVMLPEELGGERASLESIEPGKEKNFQVELLARKAGELDLIATATAEGELRVSANRPIVVRRANLGVGIVGPKMKYAGGTGNYTVEVSNSGDAIAQEVIAAVALPLGVKYVSGIESAKTIEGGVRWNVGTLAPGDKRTYRFQCELNSAGDLQVEAGARGMGDLAASNACVTKVDTIADLVLTVHDPKGPLPIGEEIVYQIHAKNRGTRAAKMVDIVMQFSEGIEPTKAEGQKHRVIPGQVVFAPVEQIEPGQEVVLNVSAKALKNGAHIFRAQLVCKEADSREIAEGTTRFFGDSADEMIRTATKPANDNSFAPVRK